VSASATKNLPYPPRFYCWTFDNYKVGIRFLNKETSEIEGWKNAPSELYEYYLIKLYFKVPIDEFEAETTIPITIEANYN